MDIPLTPELTNFVNNYIVPPELKSTRTENDLIWHKMAEGPDTTAMDHINEDSTIDDLSTELAGEWLKMMQAIRNIAVICDTIVDKYDIKNGDIVPSIPEVLNMLWRTTPDIVNIETSLADHKAIYFTLEKIRNDWGSLDAYSNAPLQERDLWFDVNCVRSGHPTELLFAHLRRLLPNT